MLWIQDITPMLGCDFKGILRQYLRQNNLTKKEKCCILCEIKLICNEVSNVRYFAFRTMFSLS
jgi:hypothetical protein